MKNSEKTKLSQWDALILESLKSFGWSNDELIRRVKERELPTDDSDFHFDYQLLSELESKEPETFRDAVLNGYRIKYNTIRGIRSWIVVAYNREPELILDEGQEAVVAELTVPEMERLSSVLSVGWKVEEAAGQAGIYRVVPVKAV